MIALGVEGLRSEVEDGVHLRWQFDPALRFPGYGFDLYRRAHLPGQPTLLSVQARADGSCPLGGLYRDVQLVVVHQGDGAFVTARLWGRDIAEAGLSSGVGAAGVPEGVELMADAIDEVVLPVGATLQSIDAIPVDVTYFDPRSGGIDPSWGSPLNGSTRILLPLTQTGYPRHPRAPNDAAEAEARLERAAIPGGALSLPADVAARYLGTHFQDLRGVLASGLAAGGPGFPTTPAGGVGPTIQIDPYELLLIAAIDPNIARILGLLWVDRTAQSGVAYDYLVVGYWVLGTRKETVCGSPGRATPGTVVTPGTWVTPGGVTVGVPGGGTTPGRTTGGFGGSMRPIGFGHGGETGTATTETPVFRLEEGVSGTVVAVDSPWGLDRGIELSGGRPQTARIELETPTDEVQLRVQGVPDQIYVAAFDGQGRRVPVAVETTPAGGGFTQITVTGTAIKTLDVRGVKTILQVCTVKEVPNTVTHAWISYDVVQQTPAPLEIPAPVTGTGIPNVDTETSALTRPSTIRDRHGLAAGVRWPLPEGSTGMLPRTAVVYHVSRQALGDGDQPDPAVDLSDPNDFQRLTVDMTDPAVPQPIPVRPLRGLPSAPLPDGWPQDPVRYVDAHSPNRWYEYAIRGQDLFGRLSDWAAGTIELRDMLAPPPPFEIEAVFVDANAAMSDPDYNAELQALIPTGADGALVVRWTWPPSRYRQASDVAEFRVYWEPGRLNTRLGTVIAVTASTDTSQATVALDGGTIASPMTDGWLRIGDEFFTVVSSGTGNPVTLTVRNLRLTRTASGQSKPPPTGRCTLAIGPGETLTSPGAPSVKPADPNWVDYRDPRSWAERLDVVDIVQPLEGSLTNVAATSLSGTLATGAWVDDGDGTSTVATGLTLRRAAGLLAGGSITVGGATFQILANGEGANTSLTVQNTGAGAPPAAPSPAPTGAFTVSAAGVTEVATNIAATSLPASSTLADMAGGILTTPLGDFPVFGVRQAGAPPTLTFALSTAGGTVSTGNCAWYPAYRIAIANPGLTAVGGTVAGAVGISSADVRDYAADPRGDPARTGNEGAVSGPLVVMRADRTPPAATTAPAATLPSGQLHIYASVPDFDSKSRYTLTWPVSGAADSRYIVYRALDEALFLRDREQRRAGTGFYTAGAFTDDPGFSNWWQAYSQSTTLTQADLTTAEATLPASKREPVARAWEAWAARFYSALSDAAIRSLADRAGNETAFSRINAEPVAAASWDDVLDGRSASRFLYRVQTVDGAGNQSGLSPTSLPVYIPDVVTPRAPSLLEAAAGAGVVTVRWVENTEDKLDHYRLYRATTADDAQDIRAMDLHARLTRRPNDPPGVGEVAPARVTGTTDRLEYADTVDPNEPYWYRIVGVDNLGNRSVPSVILQGMAYGAPPVPVAVTSAAWSPSPAGLAIRVQWTPDNAVQVRVQRRAQGSPTWLAGSDWVDGDQGTADALSAESWLSQDVRLEARAASGNFTTLGGTVTLAAREV